NSSHSSTPQQLHPHSQGFIIKDKENFAAMATTRVQRIMTQPINLIFRFLQS
ncbi:hypothetical protein MKX03_028978, partial [Papaver bracteatum]